MNNFKTKISIPFIFFVIFFNVAFTQNLLAQPIFKYPNTIVINGGGNANAYSGSGSFTNPVAIPNFTWAVTSANGLINSVANVQSVDEMRDANLWEAKYPPVTTSTPCLKARQNDHGANNGDPIGLPMISTITFATPTDRANWGFLILDIDVDQVDISATKPDGSSFTIAEINTWFKGLGDADIAAGNNSPCFSMATNTLVGSLYAPTPCAKVLTLSNATDTEGAYAYFEPNAPVKSISFSYYNLQYLAQPSYRIFLSAAEKISISGNVFNDVNGITDATVNGTGIATISSSSLFAYLVSNTGVILDSAKVKSNGAYTFDEAIKSATLVSKNVIITINEYAIGTTNPMVALPAGWSFVGDNLGTGSGSDALPNGELAVNVGTANITNINFGVQRIPESAVSLLTAQNNQNGIHNITVPASLFQFSNVGLNPNTQDYDGGTITNIKITAFPSNTNSITINSILYTSGSWPIAGITIPFTNGVGPNWTILIDPVDGYLDVVIPFVSIDNASKEDQTPGSVTMNFTSVLATKFVNFTAYKAGNTAVLNFSVDNLATASVFNIERSVAGQNFSTIGEVSATANSLYSFIDFKPELSVKNYYRIKETEATGKISYSETRMIKYNDNFIVEIYPIPATNNVYISFQEKMINKPANIIITNLLGQLVLNKKIVYTKSTESINTNELENGAYQISIICNDERINKMIMIQK